MGKNLIQEFCLEFIFRIASIKLSNICEQGTSSGIIITAGEKKWNDLEVSVQWNESLNLI